MPLNRVPLNRVPPNRVPLNRVPLNRVPLNRVPLSRACLNAVSLSGVLLGGAAEVHAEVPVGPRARSLEGGPERGAPAAATRVVVLQADSGLGLGSLARVRGDLEAGLAQLGVRVVLEPSDQASAIVTFRAGVGDVVVVEIDDRLTSKRLARDVDVGELPADTQELALALAADELLRASWVELELHVAPPEASQDAVEPKAAQPGPVASHGSSFSVELGPSVRHFAQGSTLLGGELALVFQDSRLLLELGAMALISLDRTTEAGTVRGSAAGGSFGAGFRLVRGSSWSLGPEVGFDLLRMELHGVPRSGFLGGSMEGMALDARLGVFSRWDWGRFCLSGDFGLAYVPVAVVARADGAAGGGAAGLGVWAGLRGGGRF